MSVADVLPGPSCAIANYTSESSYSPTSDGENASSDEGGPLPHLGKVCDYPGCRQRFRKNDQLERHIYHVHTKIKKFVCTRDGCYKPYMILSHLKRHIKTFHEKKHEAHVERMKCTIPSCERLFNTRTSLNRHIREYHENKIIHKCAECEFSCRQKRQYVRHIQKHFPTQEIKKIIVKRHACQKCGAKFSKWSELQNHRNKDHVLKCEVCEKTFKLRVNLRSHMLDHRNKALNKSFSCPHEGCNNSYLHKRNLNAHIQTIHLNLRFKCPFANCKSSFTSKRRLKKHEELHGKEDIVVERRPQSIRKDKGMKKVPTMSVLTGVRLEPQLSKLILAGKADEVEIDYSSFTTTTDSDGEEVPVPSSFHIKMAKGKKTLFD